MDDAYRLISAFFQSTSEGLKLLKAEPDLAKARTSLGETPLHYLAVENRLEAVQALVKTGSSVNTISEVNGTPILEAAQLGHLDMLKYLLSVGADLDVVGQEEPILVAATRQGKLDIVKVLIEAGANVNVTDSLSETPLHVAAKKNDVEMARFLIECGADLKAKRWGETPFDLARDAGATATQQLLSSTGE